MQEIIEFESSAIHTLDERSRVIALRDTSIPLVDPDTALGINSGTLDRGTIRAVVVHHTTGSVAVAVDRVLGDEEIVVKSLGEEFDHVQGISGATILGDGRIGLIIETNEMISREFQPKHLVTS